MGAAGVNRKSTNVLLGLALVVAVTGAAVLSFSIYSGKLTSSDRVTLYVDRAGLMLEKGSDVKVSGVVVGHVSSVRPDDDKVIVSMDISSDYAKDLPANTNGTIDPTTLFGRKFVTLIRPEQPSDRRLTAGSVIEDGTTTTEVNDLLESLVTVLRTVDPQRVSNTLTGLSTALAGVGDNVGNLVVDLDGYLRDFNPHLDELQKDMQYGSQVAETVAQATPDILDTVRNLTTTSGTITEKEKQLSAFLLSFSNFGASGENLFVTSGTPLQKAVSALQPTSAVLGEFSPILPCFIANLAQTNRHLELTNSGSGRPGLNILGTLLAGNPPYSYPDNLPKTGLDNGPSCYPAGPKGAGHVNFDDGSDAYAPIQGPTDFIGNPLADLLFGGSR
ncbi:phospholipid/cholesterol/gamma-HCH transport system substrate-binding protein [Williamsia limnetica]|uniref:Phospholipid/cholesterol/gamma-HCH transport system substrate-binding protein n=1 Tax=Williamsia limnetica TaxID=882452 RepID=A0A318REC7_WILLI|nr:MCE family protein [Williamsia limnetica]PYE12365.1 phospholipid/cholesterol/gamma-HCH transport system substrate-binding protein [Williamsia limnetica]